MATIPAAVNPGGTAPTFHIERIARDDEGVFRSTTEAVEHLKIRTADSAPELNQPAYPCEIIFYPPIHVDSDGNGPPPPELAKDEALCKRLATELLIDPYFLTVAGWDSNGFYHTKQFQIVLGGQSRTVFATSCRFLVKSLKFEGVETSTPYAWLYLYFHQIWVPAGKDENGADLPGCCYLLCFDDVDKLKDSLVKAFRECDVERIKTCRFAAWDVLLGVIIKEYDEKLWKFRKPVRNVEKDRKMFAGKLRDPDLNKEDATRLIDSKYEHMHELSRHAVHMSETLECASSTMDEILKSCEAWYARDRTASTSIIHDNTVSGLKFSFDFLGNLKKRSDAFTERIKNEIQLAYSIVNAQVVAESRDDTKNLALTISALSLIFLPGTFVSGFFGMNFFSMTDTGKLTGSPDIWIFFLITVPITYFSYLSWVILRKKNQPRGLVRRATGIGMLFDRRQTSSPKIAKMMPGKV